MKTNGKAIQVDPRLLTFSPWNVNSVSTENMEKLKESVKRNGIFRPVVVREMPDGTYQVIAGEHTTRVSMELGHETIDVYNLGRITEKQAKEISIIDNQHYGVEDTFGLGELLKEIDANPAEFLPFSDEALNTIFRSTQIDLDSLELDDEDLIPDYKPDEVQERARVDHQIMRFKVPIADCERVTRTIEAIIKRQGLKDRDSMLAAGMALVHLCNAPIEVTDE